MCERHHNNYDVGKLSLGKFTLHYMPFRNHSLPSAWFPLNFPSPFNSIFQSLRHKHIRQAF